MSCVVTNGKESMSVDANRVGLVSSLNRSSEFRDTAQDRFVMLRRHGKAVRELAAIRVAGARYESEPQD